MRGKADETKALLAGVLAENFRSLGGELENKKGDRLLFIYESGSHSQSLALC